MPPPPQGFVSSGPVVLLMDLLLKDGPFYSEAALAQLFRWGWGFHAC